MELRLRTYIFAAELILLTEEWITITIDDYQLFGLAAMFIANRDIEPIKIVEYTNLAEWIGDQNRFYHIVGEIAGFLDNKMRERGEFRCDHNSITQALVMLHRITRKADIDLDRVYAVCDKIRIDYESKRDRPKWQGQVVTISDELLDRELLGSFSRISKSDGVFTILGRELGNPATGRDELSMFIDYLNWMGGTRDVEVVVGMDHNVST